MGTATGAFARARVEYGPTNVAPFPLRSQSMKIFPLRFAFDAVAMYFSGSSRTMPSASSRQKSRARSQVIVRSIATQM